MPPRRRPAVRLSSVFALVGVALVLSMLALARPASANGRFPNAQQLRELDGRTLVVAGTYGMLVTTNAGVDFAYQCEAEIFGKPTGSYTVDPLLEVGPDGAVYSGSLHGLRVSRDRGCTFATEPSLPRNWSFFELAQPPGADNGRVIDVCRRGGEPDAPVLALVAMVDATGRTTEHRLYETDARGVFGVVGAPLPLTLLDYGLTLEVAPSDPERIYVTGTLTNDPVLIASDDGGATFRSGALVLGDPDAVIGAYLGAVSPVDPERLYVRVARREQTDDGLYVRSDSLAVSSDGGRSVGEVLRQAANLLGFAVSPDGAVVLAGYGDPKVDETLSDTTVVGLYRAEAGALAFEHVVRDMDVSCVRAREDGFYVCALERDPQGIDTTLVNDFHLGFQRGFAAPASAADFETLLEQRHVRGPAPWADGRVTACELEWTGEDPNSPFPGGSCSRLNACDDDTELSPGALVCGEAAGASGAAGSSGMANGGNAGNAGSGGTAGAGPKAGSGDEADDGCGCRLAPNTPAAPLGWLAAVLAVTLGRRAASRQCRAKA